MDTDDFTLRTGKLPVSGGHRIWYMEWGNKAASVPIFFLHGGPGSESKNSTKTAFDPRVHRVVFFDQRGCGQSTPQGALTHNTTQDLIEDIELLRKHLGDDRLMLSGGSWGSTLALAYAIHHRKRVHKMLLHGIFLGTQKEVEYLHQGSLQSHFPEAWQQYIEVVPKDREDDTTQYYHEQFGRSKGKRFEEFVRRWTLLESAASSTDGDFLKEQLQADGTTAKNQQMACIEAHYFVHNCFLPDNFIMENAGKLANIPMVFVQGRYDHVCPPLTAYQLAQAIGGSCQLHLVPSNHKKELALLEVIRAYAWAFLV